MATRKLVLGSAGSLLLAGTMAIAVPGLAQNASPADQAAYEAAQARYNAQVQEYNDKTRAYQQQRDDYTAKLNAYNNNAAVYADQSRRYVASEPSVVVETPPPAVVVQTPPPAATVVVQNPPVSGTAVVVPTPAPSTTVVVAQPDPFVQRLVFASPPVVLWKLDMVADPNNQLFNAVVVDAAGLPVGHFRRVESKEPGYDAVVITLTEQRRTISLPVEHIRFDPNAGVIIADLSTNEIISIPSGFPYG